MKVPFYNKEGEKVGEIELNEEVFGQKLNPDLVHQAVIYYLSQRRKPIAKTKDRSEVRGGGRKPWPQKETGRARHGSIRSPLWRHGGVTFGPTPQKKYQKKLPKKMKIKALKMVLSQKLRDNEIIIVDKLDVEEPKTKVAKKILENLSKVQKDILKKRVGFILAKAQKSLLRCIKNLPKVATLPFHSINLIFLLENKFIVIEKEAIEKIAQKLISKK